MSVKLAVGEGAGQSTLVSDSSAPLMSHDPSDLGSLILIQIIQYLIPKGIERTHRLGIFDGSSPEL